MAGNEGLESEGNVPVDVEIGRRRHPPFWISTSTGTFPATAARGGSCRSEFTCTMVCHPPASETGSGNGAAPHCVTWPVDVPVHRRTPANHNEVFAPVGAHFVAL